MIVGTSRATADKCQISQAAFKGLLRHASNQHNILECKHKVIRQIFKDILCELIHDPVFILFLELGRNLNLLGDLYRLHSLGVSFNSLEC